MRRTTVYPTETGHALVALLVFDHPDMTSPLFVTDASQDLLVNGELYESLPIQPVLPAIGEDGASAGRLTIDNVSRRLVREIRTLAEPITCELRVVREAAPDQIERGPYDFEVKNVKWGAMSITADLTYDQVLGVAIPCDLMGPATTPGLYRT